MALLWWPEGCSASGFGQVLLAREETVLALAATHPLAQRDVIAPDDIRDETVLDAPPEWRRSLNASRIGALGRRVQVVRTIDEAAEHVMSGLGVALVPPSVAAAHLPAAIVTRPLLGAPKSEFVAVWRQEDKNLSCLRSLIRCVVRAAQVTFEFQDAEGAS
jgi:DNA-binding transcriptional LysR family regulator